MLSYARKEVEVEWMNPIPKSTNFIHMTLVVEKIPLPETAARYYQALASVSPDTKVRASEESILFKKVARAALVAFSERENEKVGKFNKPSDDAQQLSFKRFTEESLNPILLEKGMRVKYAEFEIQW